MAKISLDVFTHKGKTFTQFIDTDDDSVTIEMMAGKTRQPMIHFDSSYNVRSTDGKNIGNIGGWCEDAFTFTFTGENAPSITTVKDKRDPAFIFKFEKEVFSFLADYVQMEKTAKCGEVTATFTERHAHPNKEKTNTVQDQVKLHGCKIGDEIKPSQKQKSWLRSEHIHTSSNAEFTGAPGSNPGVQLSRSNDSPVTWIPAPVKKACGVERVNNKWHWLIKSDDVGDVEGVRSFCLGNGELRCDGCGQEKNWVALNKLPDEKRLAIQSNAKRIDDMACIILQRPWHTTLPEPVIDAAVID